MEDVRVDPPSSERDGIHTNIRQLEGGELPSQSELVRNRECEANVAQGSAESPDAEDQGKGDHSLGVARRAMTDQASPMLDEEVQNLLKLPSNYWKAYSSLLYVTLRYSTTVGPLPGARYVRLSSALPRQPAGCNTSSVTV